MGEIEAEERAKKLAAKEFELRRLREEAAAEAAAEEEKRKAEAEAKAALAMKQFKENAAAEEAKLQKEIEEKTKALQDLRNMVETDVEDPSACDGNSQKAISSDEAD